MHSKSIEDPVILTLSSDDDEENPSTSKNGKALDLLNEDSSSKLNSSEPILERINSKEPIVMENVNYLALERYHNNFPGLKVENENLSQVSNGAFISLQCRAIRIGSYKVVPVDRAVISYSGLQIVVPPYAKGEKEKVTLFFPMENVVKVLGHFGNTLPIFFFYIAPSTAAIIRTKLKMEDKNGFYFDPCSYEQSQKRVTLLPEKMKAETVNLIKNLLNFEILYKGADSRIQMFEEISQKEANEILVRSSPYETDSLAKNSKTTVTYETKTLLIYPPPPNRGGISITMDDYFCLKDEQFLNDVLIDFYLKWLLMSKLKDKDRERTLMFSTFFYKRLTSKPKKGRPHSIEDDPNLTAAQKRHARVKSWTKNVDIFQKDFILIPINEHSHWFLAVICFLGLDGPVTMEGGKPAPKVEPIPSTPLRKSSRSRKAIEIPIIDDGDWSDRDEAEGNEYELDDDTEEEEKEPPNKKCRMEFRREVEEVVEKIPGLEELHDPPIKQPCILIFDSLAGANRSRIVATLREYLMVEHQLRKGKHKIFSKDTMRGACPKVPQQTNYSDCGIYTLQFAEYFFECPLTDFRFPIKTLRYWFGEEVVSRKREDIAKLIRSLMNEHKPNHGINLPPINFSTKSSTEGDEDCKIQIDGEEGEEAVVVAASLDPEHQREEGPLGEPKSAALEAEISFVKDQSQEDNQRQLNLPEEKKINFKITNKSPNKYNHSKKEPNLTVSLTNASLKLLCDSYKDIIDSDDDEIFIKDTYSKDTYSKDTDSAHESKSDNVKCKLELLNPLKKGR